MGDLFGGESISYIILSTWWEQQGRGSFPSPPPLFAPLDSQKHTLWQWIWGDTPPKNDPIPSTEDKKKPYVSGAFFARLWSPKNAIFFKKQHKKQDSPHFAISTLHSCLFNDLHSEPPKRLFCYLLFCYFFVFAFPHNLGYAQGTIHLFIGSSAWVMVGKEVNQPSTHPT